MNGDVKEQCLPSIDMHTHTRTHERTHAHARATAAAVRARTPEHKLFPSPSFLVSGQREEEGRSVRTLHQIESVSPHVVAAAHCIASLFSFHFQSNNNNKKIARKKHNGPADQILKINYRIIIKKKKKKKGVVLCSARLIS